MPVTHESFCSPRPSASASPYTVYTCERTNDIIIIRSVGSQTRRDHPELRAAGVAVVGIAGQPNLEGAIVDVDGTYGLWFAEYGCAALAVRANFYIYGTTADTTATRALATDLVEAVSGKTSEPAMTG